MAALLAKMVLAWPDERALALLYISIIGKNQCINVPSANDIRLRFRGSNAQYAAAANMAGISSRHHHIEASCKARESREARWA